MKLSSTNSLLSGFTYVVIFSVLSLSASMKASAQELITIEQAVARTLQNNLQIKQAQFTEAITDENLRQSKNALLPTVSGSGNYSRNFGRSIDPSTNQFINQQFTSFNGSLSAGVDLFSGLQKINQIKQNKLLLDADKTNIEKIKNDLILQVVTSYMQILFNKDLLLASRQQLEVANLTLKQQERLLDAGNKTLADVSEAKSQVATAELNVTNAQNDLTISFLTLSQLMELPTNIAFQVQPPLVETLRNTGDDVDISQVYASALKTFPDIKLADLRSQAAEKEVDIARGSYYPRLSLGGGLGTNYSNGRTTVISVTPNGFREIGRTQSSNDPVLVPDFTTVTGIQSFNSQIKDNFNQSLGLNLQIPIFGGWAVRSNVRRAKISYQNALVGEQLVKNNLNKVISQAVADLQAARGRYSSTEKAFAAQKDAFYVIEQRYNVGLVNSLDYNTSRTNRNRSEIDFIQAKYDLLFRSKVIDYYLGKQITF
jgi:outer membrane protein